MSAPILFLPVVNCGKAQKLGFKYKVMGLVIVNFIYWLP